MYNSFAYAYDVFSMRDSYALCAGNIKLLFEKFGLKPETILDLGCGSGGVTIPLARLGYKMIGLDVSGEMLAIAREKSKELDIFYVNQDMRKFKLHTPVDACVSVRDVINHILKYSDCVRVISLVKKHLRKGGLFVFDVFTDYALASLASRGSFGQTTDNISFVCEMNYDRILRRITYNISVFAKRSNENLFTRNNAVIIERAYSIGEMKKIISLSGLSLVRVYDADTLDKPKGTTKRALFVCERP